MALIIEYFCFKCEKAIDILSENNKCSDCGTGFVEEMTTPTKPFNRTELSPEKAECSICLQDMDSTKDMNHLKTELFCGHSFHKQCIKDWFKTGRNNCPLCRGAVDVPSVVTPVTQVSRWAGPIPISGLRSRSPISIRRNRIQFDRNVTNAPQISNVLRATENRSARLRRANRSRYSTMNSTMRSPAHV